MTTESIEYRIIEKPRYIVTRFEAEDIGDSAGPKKTVRTLGEYADPATAYQVGYALAKADHERMGWPIADERIKYPEQPRGASVVIPGSVVGME